MQCVSAVYFPEKWSCLPKFNQKNMTSHGICYRGQGDLNTLSAIAFSLACYRHAYLGNNGDFLQFLWCNPDALFWNLRSLQCCWWKICLSLSECIKFLPSLKWSLPCREAAAPLSLFLLWVCTWVAPTHHIIILVWIFWQTLLLKAPFKRV